MRGSKAKPKWLYGLLSTIVAFSLVLADVRVSQGFPWQQLLFQGIELIQLTTLSDSQEVQIGQQIRQELVRSREVKLNQNPRLNRYLNRIGQSLVQVSDRPNIPYKFQVVDSDEVNAFATMGGFVYINTGLMKMASNEAELASVVAHEIAHVTARHSVKQMQQQAISRGLLTATGLDRDQVVQIGVTLALDLPHSRQDEYEADRLGLIMLTRAGYAPRAMVDFMEKLQQQSGSVPTFLSTHPAAQDRAIALAEQIPSDTGYQGKGLNSQRYQATIRSFL